MSVYDVVYFESRLTQQQVETPKESLKGARWDFCQCR